MRFLGLLLVTAVRGQPKCLCNPGRFYSGASSTRHATLSGGVWQFGTCIEPSGDSVACENGDAVGSSTSGTKLEGFIDAKCIRQNFTIGNTQGQLNEASIANPSDHKSACCAQCNRGYRLKEIEQGGSHMGYVCVKQTCTNGILDASSPPKCVCTKSSSATSSFFRLDFRPEDLATKGLNPQEMIAASGKVTSTSDLWSGHAGQSQCVSFHRRCYAPDNCADNNDVTDQNCVDTNQPHATLCKNCKTGYNKQLVWCTDPTKAWVEGPDAVSNKCHKCVLASGCAAGHLHV